MDGLPRTVASVVSGVVSFAASVVFLVPAGCADVGGVPSWERCTSMVGTPAPSLSDFGLANQFDILIPLAISVFAAVFIWMLLGARDPSEG